MYSFKGIYQKIIDILCDLQFLKYLEDKIKPKLSRKREIIKIEAEINEVENF